LAQGTRLGYVITGFLDKETSSDTEINPILVEDRGDFAGPNAAYEPTKNQNPMNNNQFDIEESKRQNESSLDDEGIHLTNVALLDQKIKEPEDICRQSRTSGTDSSDRESTDTYNGSLQLTKLYTAKEKPINIEPTSHQFKTYNADFCSTFLNLTKKYLSFLAEGPHTIDVPNDQVLRGHYFSPHGYVNFIAKGSVKQHQEDVTDLKHKHEPPQLKERSSSVNGLLGAFYTIRPRADRHHALIEGTPQWGGECSYPKILNMTTPNKSSRSQVGNCTRRSIALTADKNC